jgi:uncharacterized protein (TIGR00251 family)
LDTDCGLPFLKKTESGVILSVLIKPRSRRNLIEGVNPEGLLKICIVDPPVKGAANKGLVKLLSRSLGIPKSRLTIISGETSSRKRVLIQDLSMEDTQRWWRNISAG